MGSSIYPYVVERAKLSLILGSKNKKVIPAMAAAHRSGQRMSERWDEIDEQREDGEPRCREVLEDLVMGRKQRRKFNHLYVYALESLCDLYGRRPAEYYQVQSYFREGTSASYLYDFDIALEKAGIKNVLLTAYHPFRKTKTLPVSLANDDYPFGVLVPGDTCGKIREQMVANIGKVKTEYREAALEVYGWLTEVSAQDVLALFEY